MYVHGVYLHPTHLNFNQEIEDVEGGGFPARPGQV